jgi:hypothetical protein
MLLGGQKMQQPTINMSGKGEGYLQYLLTSLPLVPCRSKLLAVQKLK